MEEDYLAICHERLEQLNESEQRISENVARLAERSEINEGQERVRVTHSIKKIWWKALIFKLNYQIRNKDKGNF